MGSTLVSRRFGAFSARTTIAILLALSCLSFRPTPAEAQDIPFVYQNLYAAGEHLAQEMMAYNKSAICTDPDVLKAFLARVNRLEAEVNAQNKRPDFQTKFVPGKTGPGSAHFFTEYTPSVVMASMMADVYEQLLTMRRRACGHAGVGGFYGWTGSFFAGGNSTLYGFDRREESRTLTASPAFEGGGSVDYIWALPGGYAASLGLTGVVTKATASPDEERRNIVIKGYSDAFYFTTKFYSQEIATPSATLRAYVGPLAGFARTYITERDDTKYYNPFIYGVVGGFTYTPSDQSIPLTYFVQATYLTSSSYATDNVKLNSFGGQFGLTFPLGQSNFLGGGTVPPGGSSSSQNFHPWIGIVGGGGFGTGEYVEGAGGTGSFNRTGGSIGATLGYGGRIGRNKLGIEGDISWSNIDGSSTTNCAPGCGVKTEWYGTLRGIFGTELGNTNVIGYGTAGLAFGDVTAHVGGFPGVSETKAGWVAGGGIAFPTQIWAQPFVLKAEFLHMDLGSLPCARAGCGGTADVKSSSNTLRLGVNYPF